MSTSSTLSSGLRSFAAHAVLFAAALLSFGAEAAAQVDFTANDVVPPYAGRFRPGVNLGYLPPYGTSELGELAAGNPAEGIMGVGAKTTRPGLFDEVLDPFGYDVNVDNFEFFESLGMDELTALVGFPSPRHRDWDNQYCYEPGGEDKLNAHFIGIYEPIWDDGIDGTPYNEDNKYAEYIYNLAVIYSDEVRFWEIWNEPGLYTGDPAENEKFWGGPDYPGSWWNVDPDPCDYYLHAPIEHFVRVLRISYEVIKTVAPDDYVTLSGLGSASFLDAIMRNTDNPVDGSPTAEYPLGGGAYFDVLGFHTYPHFDGTTKFGDYRERHSDGAADGIVDRALARYQEVLYDYGYDGTDYPRKHHICTEINIPRVDFSDEYIAGNMTQVNFIQKALVSFKLNDVYQMHVFSIGDKRLEENASFEFHLMGLYKKLKDGVIGEEELNDEGIAYKTVSDFVYPAEYDAARTEALEAPDGVRAYAFTQPNGGRLYMVWAETTIDLSEAASAVYSFPEELVDAGLVRYEWDYSVTGDFEVSDGQDIALDATPVYFVDNSAAALPVELATFGASRSAGANVLDWATASEVNSRGFDVEHAVGTPEAFASVGFVASRANGTGAGATYGFSHETSEPGTHYYRLRQVDFDGTQEYSAVATVTVDEEAAALTLAPNPVSARLRVGGLGEDAALTVRDLTGRAVGTYRPEGGVIDVSALASGVYLLSVDGAGQRAPVRFVKE